jgi:hypothetical protein
MPECGMYLDVQPTATTFIINLLGLSAGMSLDEPLPVMQPSDELVRFGFKSFPPL